MTLRTAFEEGHICPSDSPSSSTSSDSSNSNNSNNRAYPTVMNIAMQALHDYRSQYGTMLFEVYFPFPLLLSQLVTLVVYSYFAVALIAQQVGFFVYMYRWTADVVPPLFFFFLFIFLTSFPVLHLFSFFLLLLSSEHDQRINILRTIIYNNGICCLYWCITGRTNFYKSLGGG